MADDTQPEIIRNDDSSRFELADRPESGHLGYHRSEDRITLVHTEVGDDLEGQGVGSALVRAALDHAQAEGLTVVPECEFVAGWLERHPERAAELDVATS